MFFDLIYHLLDVPNRIADGKLGNLLLAGEMQSLGLLTECDFVLFFCVSIATYVIVFSMTTGSFQLYAALSLSDNPRLSVATHHPIV